MQSQLLDQKKEPCTEHPFAHVATHSPMDMDAAACFSMFIAFNWIRNIDFMDYNLSHNEIVCF